MAGLLSRETNEVAENGLGPCWLVVSGSFEVRVFEDCRPLACSPLPYPFPILSGSSGRKSLALGWDLKLLSEEASWVQSVWWGTNGMGVAKEELTMIDCRGPVLSSGELNSSEMTRKGKTP